MRFRFLASHSVATDGLASPLRFSRPGQTLARHSLRALALGTALGTGGVLAGPLWAAPTVGGDEFGPKVQILAPGYQDVLNGKTRILLAIQANKFNPQSIEMFVDDKPATKGPIPLASFPSSSFDWDTRLFSDGAHKLTVRVTDTQGFRGWAEVNVYIKNSTSTQNLTPPSLEWKNADSLQTLSGTAKIELEAIESFGVKWVILSINPAQNPDQKPALRSWLLNRAPYSVDFDTTGVPDGKYVLDAKAYDALDQQGEAPELSLNVVNNSLSTTFPRAGTDVIKSTEIKSMAPATEAPKSGQPADEDLSKINLVPMAPFDGGGSSPKQATTPESPALSTPKPEHSSAPNDNGPLGVSNQTLNATTPHTLRATQPEQQAKPVLEANASGADVVQAPEVPATLSAAVSKNSALATGAVETKAAPSPTEGTRFAARPTAPDFGSRNVTADNTLEPAAEVVTEATLSATHLSSRLTAAVSKAAVLPIEATQSDESQPQMLATLPSGAQSESRLVLDAPSLSEAATPEGSTAVPVDVEVPEAETVSAESLRVASPSLSQRALPSPRLAEAPKAVETSAPELSSSSFSSPASRLSRPTAVPSVGAAANAQTRVAQPSLSARQVAHPKVEVARAEVSPAPVAPAFSAPTAPETITVKAIQVAPGEAKSGEFKTGEAKPSAKARIALNNAVLQRWESGPRAAARLSRAVRPASAIAKAGIKSVASGVKSRVAALPRTAPAQALDTTQAITVSPIEVSDQKAFPVVHRVERTTTLRAVAARYGLPVELVAACNQWPMEMNVVRGMTVKLPRPLQVSYKGVPVAGDSPSLLMGKTGVTAFRFLFEQAGGKLEWDAANQRVLATKGKQQIELTVGSKVAKVNDREVMMELAAFLFEGRTMVPVRFFEQGLHAQVDWDPQTGRLVVAMANDAAIR